MSVSQSSEASPLETGQRSTKRSEKLSISERLLAAVPMLGLQSAKRSNRTIDDVHRQHVNANFDLLYGDKSDETGGEEMSDNSSMILGDNVENHYHPAPQAGPAPGGMGKLAKAAALTALGLGTGGIGFAIPSIIDALKPEDKVPVVATPIDHSKMKTEPSIGILSLGEPD